MDGVKYERCWLYGACKSRTASCLSMGPTDNGCPVYRWFRKLIESQMKQEAQNKTGEKAEADNDVKDLVQ